MQKYVIMGVQGSGKGTQARKLSADMALIHISVGELFRWHVQARTQLGTQVAAVIAAGNMVDDETVNRVVSERLRLHDWNYGFILDGYPRTSFQAEFFLRNFDVDAVIHIEIPDADVIARIQSRRICGQCGQDFNLAFRPPKVAEICDSCGGRLIIRSDDNEQGIRLRLKDYRIKTEPVLTLFRKKERVFDIDGRQDSDAIQAEIRTRLHLTSTAKGAN